MKLIQIAISVVTFESCHDSLYYKHYQNIDFNNSEQIKLQNTEFEKTCSSLLST